jgi:hypothetical protein
MGDSLQQQLEDEKKNSAKWNALAQEKMLFVSNGNEEAHWATQEENIQLREQLAEKEAAIRRASDKLTELRESHNQQSRQLEEQHGQIVQIRKELVESREECFQRGIKTTKLKREVRRLEKRMEQSHRDAVDARVKQEAAEDERDVLRKALSRAVQRWQSMSMEDDPEDVMDGIIKALGE